MRDPIKAYQRRNVAARRIGRDAKCPCGEDRPEALIRGNDSISCEACKRRNRGQTVIDKHHFAGRANSSSTISVPVNDHRAELTTAQYDWPKTTLENLHGSPLLVAAAYIRGIRDTIVYLLKKLSWVAEFLEALDTYLTEHLGHYWWRDTELRDWTSKEHPDGN